MIVCMLFGVLGYLDTVICQKGFGIYRIGILGP